MFERRSDFSIGHGADEDRLPCLRPFLDVVCDRCELVLLVDVHEVGLIEACDRLVGRDDHDLESVDLHELTFLGDGRTGHPGELFVHAEVVLERDRREGLVLLLDRHAFLCLDRLMEAFRVPPALEDPAGELVDDHHLAVADQVVDILLVERLGLERNVEVMDEVGVRVVVEVLDAEQLLDPRDTGLGGHHLALLLIHLVVVVLAEAVCDPCELGVPLSGLADAAGDDQRRPRLIDEDRVDLIHNGVGVAPLHHVLGVHRHVVAEVVEPELVVGAVGDVRCILRAALLRRHPGLDDADLEAEEAVDVAHPFGITCSEVVVDSDLMDTFAGERVEVRGHRRDERLALTGLLLGDHAAMEGSRTDDLDVVVALTEDTLGCLADGGIGLGLDVIEGFARCEALLNQSVRARRSSSDSASSSGSSALTRSASASSSLRRFPAPARSTREKSDIGP